MCSLVRLGALATEPRPFALNVTLFPVGSSQSWLLAKALASKCSWSDSKIDELRRSRSEQGGIVVGLVDVSRMAALGCPEFCVNGFEVNAVSSGLQTG